MLVPLVAALGFLGVYVAARTTLRAARAYRRLTPLMIAGMNGVVLTSASSRTAFDRFPGGFETPMSETEAFWVLGIDEAEITRLDAAMLKRHHRQAMLANHPDRGGSPYLARKVNQARDVLDKGYLLKRG